MPHQFAEVFDAETAAALGRAFDDAWQALQTGRMDFPASVNDEQVREKLALRIIKTAQDGERDPARLRDDAVDYVADGAFRNQA